MSFLLILRRFESQILHRNTQKAHWGSNKPSVIFFSTHWKASQKIFKSSFSFTRILPLVALEKHKMVHRKGPRAPGNILLDPLKSSASLRSFPFLFTRIILPMAREKYIRVDRGGGMGPPLRIPAPKDSMFPMEGRVRCRVSLIEVVSWLRFR